MFEFIILITGCLAAYGITKVSIAYANRRGLVDYPGERSSHIEATPRGGGVSLVAVTLFGALLLAFSGEIAWPVFNGLVLSSLPVICIGYLDDHRDVSSIARFAVHLIAAGIVIFYLRGFPVIPIFGMEVNAGSIGWFLGILFLAWLLNLYNFMDGTDGIAALEAVFIAVAMMFFISISDSYTSINNTVPRSLLLLCLLVCSGSVAFLLFNFPPARIFMGDVASGFLGFFLGGVGLAAVSAGVMNIWTLLILFGVFLVDATLTLLRRVFRGDRWYSAHRTHGYQRYVTKMETHLGRATAHRRLLAWVMAGNLLLLFPFAWLSVIYPELGCVFAVVSLLPIALIDWRLGAGLPGGKILSRSPAGV